MAVYKVIQDIESEDRLLGPLTFKGLVYVMIVGLCGFIDFRLLLSDVGPLKWIVIFLLLLPMILFGVLALPFGREQPTEVWLLSKIRYFLHPHKRTWNQSGVLNLVTITAPKKIEAILSKNFSNEEVKSRLSALANTLDSRGWSVKNVNVNLNSPAAPNYFTQHEDEERLVTPTNVLQEVPEINITAADDILDEKNNPAAQNMQALMRQSELNRQNALKKKVETARVEYLGVAPKKDTTSRSIHDLKPQPLVGFGPNARKVGGGSDRSEQGVNRVTPDSQADKLELAQSGNDLSVASIAKLAGRNDVNNGEIAVSFH